MLRRALIAAIACAALSAPALAQQPGSGQNQPTGAGIAGTVGGHMLETGGGVPVITNGTIDDGSTDNVGSFVGVTSANAAVITFAFPFLRAPFCDVTGYSAAPVYTVSALAITFTTDAIGSRYTWQCMAKPGG